MKKLSLPINIAVIACLLISCQNNKSIAVEKAEEVREAVNKQSVLMDSNKSVNQTHPAGTAGKAAGEKKDSISKINAAKGIDHRSPDQSRLDSIKNMKTKSK